ncbi:MAG: hypothetical protein LLG06_15890 [Desulfobacteraceae bacterium]|nr:hypothetical protein [Desulfobacteraceae bacterium]
MQIRSAILFLVLSLAFFGTAFSQDGISEKLAEQQNAIRFRLARGDLTAGEASTLNANLAYVRNLYERTVQEETYRLDRGRILGLLDRNSLMIHQKQHNPVVRLK